MTVAAVARTTSDLDSLVTEIKEKYNVPAFAITAELLTDSAETIVSQAVAALGPIDVLINNAGIVRMVAFQAEKSLEFWWRVHELNVKVPMSFILAVLPSFVARGSGTLITLGSTAAFASDVPTVSSYGSAKIAIHRAMEVLDRELRPQRILTFTVHPGFIATGLTAREHTTETEEERLMLAGMLAYAQEVVELPADTLVALTVLGEEDERVKVLSGRYYDSTWNLEKVIERGAEILEKDLLRIKENGLAWSLEEVVR